MDDPDRDVVAVANDMLELLRKRGSPDPIKWLTSNTSALSSQPIWREAIMRLKADQCARDFLIHTSIIATIDPVYANHDASKRDPLEFVLNVLAQQDIPNRACLHFLHYWRNPHHPEHHLVRNLRPDLERQLQNKPELQVATAVVDRLGDQITDEDRVTLEEFCRRFARAASQRWRKSHRILDTFRKQYENWLQADVDWPNCVSRNLVLPQSIEEEYQGSSGHVISPEPSTSTGIGARTMTKRPRKAFEDLGSKQKKRRSDDYKGKESTEVAYSAALLLKEDGREDIASVIEYMMKNPEAASKIKENLKKPVQIAIFTPEKALGTENQINTLDNASIVDDPVPSTSSGHVINVMSRAEIDFSSDDSVQDPHYQLPRMTPSSDSEESTEQHTVSPKKSVRILKREKKMKRNLGQTYKTLKGKVIPDRAMKELTPCRMKCMDRIAFADRHVICNIYRILANGDL
ncbi:hypothetical protein PYW08_009170 [Mythimna loreyi]|uniref:Uncharacterized protein n=1 Tax=Mythimna loreyi TaxID=667449 RepID=A0ACC2Q921_9NEOP|nr:hypothetical protein PYW08_009170 [Mythimna loreyi]